MPVRGLRKAGHGTKMLWWKRPRWNRSSRKGRLEDLSKIFVRRWYHLSSLCQCPFESNCFWNPHVFQNLTTTLVTHVLFGFGLQCTFQKLRLMLSTLPRRNFQDMIYFFLLFKRTFSRSVIFALSPNVISFNDLLFLLGPTFFGPRSNRCDSSFQFCRLDTVLGILLLAAFQKVFLNITQPVHCRWSHSFGEGTIFATRWQRCGRVYWYAVFTVGIHWWREE